MSDLKEKEERKSSSDIEASHQTTKPTPLSEKGPPSPEAREAATITQDGVKLHPQPTADPLDPLNWSPWRKNTILGIVMFKYAPTIPPTKPRLSPPPSLSHTHTPAG